MSQSAAGFGLNRCKALADGVMAFVLTLLVLDIQVPADPRTLGHGVFLGEIGWSLLLYVASFWLVSTYWLLHAAMMNYFRRGNRAFIWLNLLFLFPVTLVPFVAKLKGAHRQSEIVIVLFGAVHVAIGVCLMLLWHYGTSRPHLLHRPLDDALRRSVLQRLVVSPVIISLAAIAVSFVHVYLSTLLFLSVPLYYLTHRIVDERSPESEEDGA